MGLPRLMAGGPSFGIINEADVFFADADDAMAVSGKGS